MTAETKLEQLGLTLPAVPAPVAAYVPGAADGTLVFDDMRGNLRQSRVYSLQELLALAQQP